MFKYIVRSCALLLIPLLPVFASSAQIFSDSFDTHPDACHTGGDIPSGWNGWYQNDTAITRDAVMHYAGEISYPGRSETGKSLKIWRHSDWPMMNNYSGALWYVFKANYSEIYIRYYQKIPLSLSLYATDYIKAWRVNTTGGSGGIYLDFRVTPPGDMRTAGTWGIYDGTGWTTVLDNGGLRAI